MRKSKYDNYKWRSLYGSSLNRQIAEFGVILDVKNYNVTHSLKNILDTCREQWVQQYYFYAKYQTETIHKECIIFKDIPITCSVLNA